MSDIWIFGYGSLIWRPAFPYMERKIASVAGYSRRFWQASTDHRGTIADPGRVVTLIHDPEAHVVGVAYRVGKGDHDGVVGDLDVREQQGYERVATEAELDDGRVVGVTAYIARTDNPHFVGPEQVSVTAEICARARGPSGANRDYVEQLQTALRVLGTADGHVDEVAAAVRELAVMLADLRDTP